MLNDLSTPDNPQAQNVAEIIQITRPDFLALLAFDFDESGQALELFQENYLAQSQNGADPITYPYTYVFSSNTGVLSGVDFNNDENVALPLDAFGFGFFPGQFAFAILSKYEILEEEIRTCQNFRWVDM